MNFDWLDRVSPAWGTLAHAIVWIGIVAWIWRRDADSEEAGPDLRWWIVALGLVQIGIYAVF